MLIYGGLGTGKRVAGIRGFLIWAMQSGYRRFGICMYTYLDIRTCLHNEIVAFCKEYSILFSMKDSTGRKRVIHIGGKTFKLLSSCAQKQAVNAVNELSLHGFYIENVQSISPRILDSIDQSGASKVVMTARTYAEDGGRAHNLAYHRYFAGSPENGVTCVKTEMNLPHLSDYYERMSAMHSGDSYKSEVLGEWMP